MKKQEMFEFSENSSPGNSLPERRKRKDSEGSKTRRIEGSGTRSADRGTRREGRERRRVGAIRIFEKKIEFLKNKQFEERKKK